MDEKGDLRDLFLGLVVPHLWAWCKDELSEVLDLVVACTRKRKVDLNAMVALYTCGLVAPATRGTVRAYVLDVDRRSDNLDVLKGELRALRNDTAVDDDHSAAVIVKSVAVATLLIGVQVDPP